MKPVVLEVKATEAPVRNLDNLVPVVLVAPEVLASLEVQMAPGIRLVL